MIKELSYHAIAVGTAQGAIADLDNEMNYSSRYLYLLKIESITGLIPWVILMVLIEIKQKEAPTYWQGLV